MRQGGKTRSRSSQSFLEEVAFVWFFCHFHFSRFFREILAFVLRGWSDIFCDVWQHGIDDLLFTVEEDFLAKMAPKNWQHKVGVIFAETAALKLATRNPCDVLEAWKIQSCDCTSLIFASEGLKPFNDNPIRIFKNPNQVLRNFVSLQIFVFVRCR